MGGWGKPLFCALILAATGCSYGGTHNPVSFPNLPIFGDIVRTHAKPIGESYFRDFDRHADHMEVVIQAETAAVQSRQVVLVGIFDAQGNPLAGRRVEWTLEGAGSILEVDESGLKPGRGYKIDRGSAVSYTDHFAHTLQKFNDRPEEDIPLKRGWTWCVVESLTEGDTHLSIWAPGIANWDKNRRVVTLRWVDSEWDLPPVQAAPRQSQPVLTTRVRRRTDQAPIAGYRVRYRVLDGAPATLATERSRGPEVTQPTDGKGASTVTVLPAPGPGGGRTRIGVEIVRPRDPNTPAGPEVVLGQGETAIDWEAPLLSLEQVAPASVGIGEDMTLSLLVVNKGAVAAGKVAVRVPIPEGTQYVSSEPRGAVQGNEVVWQLDGVKAREQQGLRVVLRGVRIGAVTALASLQGSEGERDERSATVQVLPPEVPRLAAEVAGPRGATLNVGDRGATPGEPIELQITIRNVGTGEARSGRIKVELDGLEHASRQNPLWADVEALAPGQSRVLPLAVRPVRAGAARVVATPSLGGQAFAPAEHIVVVREAGVLLKLLGPRATVVGKPAKWTLEATNLGTVPVQNVLLQNHLPPEVEVVSVSHNGQRQGNDVSWNLGTLQPRQQATVEVALAGVQPGDRLLHEARVVAYPAGEGTLVGRTPPVEVYGRGEFAVVGVPALKLRVTDAVDPIDVGGTTSYRIDVTNDGSLPVEQAQVVATLPEEVQLLASREPALYRQEGSKLTFAPIERLPPGRTVTYRLDVTATRPGDARLRVELVVPGRDPLVHEESTNVL